MEQPTSASAPETPEYLVANHPITLGLVKHGISEKQLQTIRFRRQSQGLPFDQWAVTWGEGFPKEITPAMRADLRAYCTLKWVILDNPPGSRDKDDAWRYLNDWRIAPFVAVGMKHRAEQRQRAQRPRSKILEDGGTLNQIIAVLAQRVDCREETTNELWPRLYAELSEKGLEPKENAAGDGYRYSDFRGRSKHISYRHFANMVSQSRKKSD